MEVENAFPRVYSWTTEEVAVFLSSQPEMAIYVAVAHSLQIRGAQLLSMDESQVKGALEATARHAREILLKLRSIRAAEIATSPKPSPPIATKIEESRRTNTLNLNETKLARFPDLICDVATLTNLSFAGNKIRSIPQEIGLLSRLVTLKGGSNSLTSLPDSVGSLVKLQLLLLDCNQLSSLPETLMFCTSLKTLDVSQNKIVMLPFGLCRCSKLSKIIVYDNPVLVPQDMIQKGAKQVLALLEALFVASDTSALDMSSMSLIQIPRVILDLLAVTSLKLDNNALQQVYGLHVLTNLTSLSLEGNQVARLPFDLFHLTNVRLLNCRKNPLVSPPPSVVELGALPILIYLSAHSVLFRERTRDLFDAFDQDRSGTVDRKEFMAGLFKVHFPFDKEDLLKLVSESDEDGNGLISLDEFSGIVATLCERSDRVRFGTALELSGLGLTRFDPCLEAPEDVTVLLLAQNRLLDLIPNEMARFRALTHLDLDRNQLHDVPGALALLPQLRSVSMRENALACLPDWLFESRLVTQLEEMHLENNQLSSVPCDLVSFTALRAVGLAHNPLRNPLQRVLHEGYALGLAYLRLFYQAKKTGLLDLSGMELGSMPDEAQFEAVSTCLLPANRLNEIPEGLSRATQLVWLDLNHNHLVQVHATLCRCTPLLRRTHPRNHDKHLRRYTHRESGVHTQGIRRTHTRNQACTHKESRQEPLCGLHNSLIVQV